MAARSERRFENVDLLMSLMGENKKRTNGSHTHQSLSTPRCLTETEVLAPTTRKVLLGGQEPLREPARGSYDHNRNHLAGIPATTSPVPSVRSEAPSPPPPYQARRSLDMGSSATTTSTSTYLSLPTDLPRQGETGMGNHTRCRSSSDLPTFGSIKPPPPQTTMTTTAPRSKTMPSPTTASTGLKALFQVPVVLGESNTPTSTLSASRTSTENSNTRPRPLSSGPPQSQTRPALPEMDSMSSLNSRYSRSSAESHTVASAELQRQQEIQTQLSRPLPSQRPPSYPGGSGRPSSSNSSSNSSRGVQHNRPATQPLTSDKQRAVATADARGRLLSQLFVYQPRVVTPSTASAAAAVTAGDAVLYELDGVVPTVARPIEVVVSRPRKTSEPNPPKSLGPTSPSTQEQNQGRSPKHTQQTATALSLLPDPGSRRHELDSAAWQRRTRLFQVEDSKKGNQDHRGSGAN